MMPPFVRRCPDCGRVRLSRQFAPVEGDPALVECPVCGHRFETIDRPWLH